MGRVACDVYSLVRPLTPVLFISVLGCAQKITRMVPASTPTPSTDCVDLDEDGYGEGVDCLGPDCDDRTAWLHDTCGRCPTPCAEMVAVPGGPFGMGGDFGPLTEQPSAATRSVTVSAFAIDATEVTVAQYDACVAVGHCKKANIGHSILEDKCHGIHPNRENHPVNCVTWTMAVEYCRFVGKRLPTEAEWEKAARGTDGRNFPWGNELPTCDRANYALVARRGGAAVENYCVGDPPPVGMYPLGNSPHGAADMAGNLWEWTADWFDETHQLTGSDVDPQGPTAGTERVVRGGAWDYGPDSLRTYERASFAPDAWRNYVGFRCAR